MQHLLTKPYSIHIGLYLLLLEYQVYNVICISLNLGYICDIKTKSLIVQITPINILFSFLHLTKSTINRRILFDPTKLANFYLELEV